MTKKQTTLPCLLIRRVAPAPQAPQACISKEPRAAVPSLSHMRSQPEVVRPGTSVTHSRRTNLVFGIIQGGHMTEKLCSSMLKCISAMCNMMHAPDTVTVVYPTSARRFGPTDPSKFSPKDLPTFGHAGTANLYQALMATIPEAFASHRAVSWTAWPDTTTCVVFMGAAVSLQKHTVEQKQLVDKSMQVRGRRQQEGLLVPCSRVWNRPVLRVVC